MMPRRVLVAYVAAATQESTVTNKPYGHGTSVGHLQLIDVHGSVTWRMRVENSAGWFFRGASMIIHSQGVMTPGKIADTVQAPKRKGLYNKWVPEANMTVKRFLGNCDV